MNRKICKYRKIVISVIATGATFFPVFAYAAADFAAPLRNPLKSINSFSDFVSSVLNIVVKIGIPIAAIAIIFSGFLFVFAQGNPEKLKTAKEAFIWSIVGTAILLGAWVFAQAIGTTIAAL